jgi:hypothetical protein
MNAALPPAPVLSPVPPAGAATSQDRPVGFHRGDEGGLRPPAYPSLLILGRVRHATSGTRAAQMATNPKAIPVAVMYARMVRSPPRLGQNGD